MTEHIFNNLGYARLKKEVTAIATTFYLYDGGAATFLPGWVAGKYMYLTMTDKSSNIEIIKVTAISADILTVERGQDSSTAQTWHAGAVITQRLVAANLDQFVQKTGFRTIDYNPNGVLAAAYDGEKVYQTGGAACNTRWWRHTTGTKWRLIAGALCAHDSYDGDGYVQTVIFGEDWRDVSPDVSIAFKTVAYNGTDLWLAAGDDVYSSADGEAWTVVSTQYFTKIIWDGTQFVGVSGGTIRTTTDGVTWTTRFTAANAYSRFQDIAYDSGSGTYVAVGRVNSSQWSYEPEIRVSTNLTNWTHRAPGSAYHEELYGVAAGATHWVIVGITGEHQTAGIGSESTWTQRKSAASSQGRYGVCYKDLGGAIGGVFITVGSYGYIYRSTDDGLTWGYYGGGGGRAAVYGINDVDPDLFCAVGGVSGTDPMVIGTSLYGIAWEESTSPVTACLYGVGIGDNKMVAVGQQYSSAGKSVILITP